MCIHVPKKNTSNTHCGFYVTGKPLMCIFKGISCVETNNKTIYCQFDTRMKLILQFVTRFADRNLRHHAMCLDNIEVNKQISFHKHVNLITLSSNICAECRPYETSHLFMSTLFRIKSHIWNINHTKN